MSQSSSALTASGPARSPASRPARKHSARLRARILQRTLGMAFTAVWIVLPLLPLSAIALSWLSGL